MRGTATAPNSPREIDVGFVIPRWIHSDGPSKSNVRHTYPAGLSASSATCRSYRPLRWPRGNAKLSAPWRRCTPSSVTRWQKR